MLDLLDLVHEVTPTVNTPLSLNHLFTREEESKPRKGKGWDAMLVLEHHPVYTLGRSAKLQDLKDIDPDGCSQQKGYEVRRRKGGRRDEDADDDHLSLILTHSLLGA